MALSLDDLIGVCPNCGGTGQQPEETGQNSSSYGSKTSSFGANGGFDRCRQCVGTGRWGITETGRAFGKFIEVFQILKKAGLDG